MFEAHHMELKELDLREAGDVGYLYFAPSISSWRALWTPHSQKTHSTPVLRVTGSMFSREGL